MWRVGAKTREGKRKKERENPLKRRKEERRKEERKKGEYECCNESKKTKGEDEGRRHSCQI